MKLCEVNCSMSACVYEAEQKGELAEGTDPMTAEYQQVRNFIFAKLINTERNIKLLESIPSEPVLDLSLVFYLFRNNDPEDEEVLITNSMLKKWKVDYFQVFEDALSNTRQIMGACIKPLKEMIEEMIKGISFDMDLKEEEDVMPMYVLTNLWKRNGAVCVLFWDMVMDLADSLQSDLLVIPSSIHEVILIPEGKGISGEELNELIRSVNESELNPQDVLSDHAYRFPRSAGRMVM